MRHIVVNLFGLCLVALPGIRCFAAPDARAEPAPAAIQESPDTAAPSASAVSRLESVARLWGIVKYCHPWITAHPRHAQVDWDKALVDVLPRIEAAETSGDFANAVGDMLAVLGDPATRMSQATTGAGLAMMTPQADGTPAPIDQPISTVEAEGRKIAVVPFRRWTPLVLDRSASTRPLLAEKLKKCPEADAVILDLRRSDPPPFSSPLAAYIAEQAFRRDLAGLVANPITLPSTRSCLHDGFANDVPGLPAGEFYSSGFHISAGERIEPRPGSVAGKRLVILTNDACAGMLPSLAALSGAGVALVVHNGSDTTMLGATIHTVPLAMAVTAQIRVGDLVLANGRVGFVPDVVVPAQPADGADPAMAEALRLAAGGEPVKHDTPTATAPLSGEKRSDSPYKEMKYPTRSYRLLSLFRHWNIIHFFFPYDEHLDEPWGKVLPEFIPVFAEASDAASYQVAVQRAVARIRDGHGFVRGTREAHMALGTHLIPAVVEWIEGRAIVTAIDPSLNSRLRVGDEIVGVNERSTRQILDMYYDRNAVSRPIMSDRTWVLNLLRGRKDETLTLHLRGSDGALRDERLTLTFEQGSIMKLYQDRQPDRPTFDTLAGGYEYVNLSRLTPGEIETMFERIKSAPALIFDLRGYPQGTVFTIAPRLAKEPFVAARFSRRMLMGIAPDARPEYRFEQRFDPEIPGTSAFGGPIVVLIDENAQSQAEHSCLMLEAACPGRVTFIGSPTSGANGDITNYSLPGGISVTFSGHDVTHGDGRQLQRVGVQPDVLATPTIAGSLAKKDEVLEAAIRFLNDKRAVGK